MNAEERKPFIVSGMSKAELHEFRKWLQECCGMNFDEMSYNELHRAASAWFDEQFEEANGENF